MADENILMSRKQYDIFMKKINGFNTNTPDDIIKSKIKEGDEEKKGGTPSKDHKAGDESNVNTGNETFPPPKHSPSPEPVISEKIDTQDTSNTSPGEREREGRSASIDKNVNRRKKNKKIRKKDIIMMLRPPGKLEKKARKRKVWLTLA